MSNVKQEDMKESFECYAKGKGMISIVDLPRALAIIGINPSENDLNSIIQKHDPQGTKKIGYSSYTQIVESQQQGFTSVSADELKHVLLHMGEKLPPEEVDEMLAEADPDNSGQIYYEDFAKLLIE